MILVDTSVWINHLRFVDEGLKDLLERGQVVNHHFVTGELACGHLRNRTEILTLLKSIPQLITATEKEVLYFIEQHKLMGQGLGYLDCHLLTSIALTPSTRFWTRDKSLKAAATSLNLIYNAGKQVFPTRVFLNGIKKILARSFWFIPFKASDLK